MLAPAVAIARTARAGTRLAGKGGTTVAGRVLLKLQPDAIERLAQRLDEGSVLVSATNGKTTTSAMLAAILGEAHVPLVHNRAGSNMHWGIATALLDAETGHLVFATLHTQSAPSTIDRVIDVFPSEQQDQVRVQLASTLQGVVTQNLLPTADGSGRTAALEILIPDDAVRNLIRQAKIEQIYSVMQTNTSRGMQTMEQCLADLVLRRVITAEMGFSRSSRPDQLRGILERSGMTNFTTPAAAMNGGFTGDKSPNQSGLRLASEV